MDAIRGLNTILPPERRIVTTSRLSDLLKKPLILHGSTFSKAGETEYAHMTISIGDLPARYGVTANQTQIVNTVKFVDENKAYPIRVMFVPVAKSYAIVDPDDYPAETPATPAEEKPDA